jgi:hypothetical protein
LWELKSYSSPIANKGLNKQELHLTKIIGTKQYEIRYKQVNGEWKIDNIYDKIVKQNTLPERKDGYNYYWGFNNKDGIAEANPLKSPNFQPHLSNNGKYYLGGWSENNSFTKDGIKWVSINNDELYKEPNRYSKKYNKKINRLNK